MKRTRQAR